jgi:transposase-like protein
MEANKSKFARRYDREFKENAVGLIQSGRTVSEVARDLGRFALVVEPMGQRRPGGWDG